MHVNFSAGLAKKCQVRRVRLPAKRMPRIKGDEKHIVQNGAKRYIFMFLRSKEKVNSCENKALLGKAELHIVWRYYSRKI